MNSGHPCYCCHGYVCRRLASEASAAARGLDALQCPNTPGEQQQAGEKKPGAQMDSLTKEMEDSCQLAQLDPSNMNMKALAVALPAPRNNTFDRLTRRFSPYSYREAARKHEDVLLDLLPSTSTASGRSSIANFLKIPPRTTEGAQGPNAAVKYPATVSYPNIRFKSRLRAKTVSSPSDYILRRSSLNRVSGHILDELLRGTASNASVTCRVSQSVGCQTDVTFQFTPTAVNHADLSLTLQRPPTPITAPMPGFLSDRLSLLSPVQIPEIVINAPPGMQSRASSTCTIQEIDEVELVPAEIIPMHSDESG